VADAAEAAVAGGEMRIQHRSRRRAAREVGEADDAGADADIAIAAAFAHGGDAGGVLRLADRAQLLRPVGAVEGARLHQHGRPHVMPRADIGEDVVEPVTPARPFPQVMVRIDDALAGIEDLLLPRGEPFLADGKVVLAHAALLGGFRLGRALSVAGSKPARRL
jgi:hypothetical protein